MGAFVETLSNFRLLPQAELRVRRLFAVALPSAVTLADLCATGVEAFGLDSSITSSSDGDYAASQEFAANCARERFGGIRYYVRHAVDKRLIGIALFGQAGHANPGPAGTRTSIPDYVVEEASRDYGFRLAGPFLDP